MNEGEGSNKAGVFSIKTMKVVRNYHRVIFIFPRMSFSVDKISQRQIYVLGIRYCKTNLLLNIAVNLSTLSSQKDKTMF